MNFFYKRTLPAIILIVLAGVIVYSNTFDVPFVFDDIGSISQNGVIRDLKNFYSNSSDYEILPNRYIAYLTFAVNYHFGKLDVSGYHAVNLFIHLMTSLLVYLMLRLTFRTPYFEDQDETDSDLGLGSTALYLRYLIPLFAALLFVVHPIHTQAVTYIVQRITSLATLFFLLSVVLYIKARLSMGEGGTKRGLALLAGSTIAAILAMKTKEIAFTLPLVVAIYELFFFAGSWWKRLLCLLPLLATLAIIPMTMIGADSSATVGTGPEIGEMLRVDSTVSRADYLLTQFRVMVTYLRLLVLPTNQNIDYDYPIYTAFFTPPVFLSFLFLLALFGLAIYLFWKSEKCRNKQVESQSGSAPPKTVSCYSSTFEQSKPQREVLYFRLISFGICWFFLTISVESSIIPIVDVIVEHRLYLPGFGAATVAATIFLLVASWATKPFGVKFFQLSAIIVILALGIATWQRNQVWSNPVHLWQDAVNKSPDKARPHNNLGFSLTEAERFPEAIRILARAIKLEPEHPNAYYNLGRVYLLDGKYKDAIPPLKKAIMRKADFTKAYINLAAAYNQIGQYLNTVALLERNMKLLDSRVETYVHLALAQARLGNEKPFRKYLARVEREDPALAAALRRRIQSGKEKGAERKDRGLKRSP